VLILADFNDVAFMTNSLTFPILRVLADGQFHSGEALAQRFDVTRATIWNAIQDAEAMGVRIFSVKGKGYRLPAPTVLLDRLPLNAAIADLYPALHLEVHDELPSTNTYLMQRATDGARSGTCAVALMQTQGRGRRGRVWQSGLGGSLTFSVLWRFQAGAAALSGLSLAVGVALVRALREFGVSDARLKWPNDVLIDYRKLAGILIELQGDMDGPSAAVIGIGINMHLPDAVRAQIDQPVIDLASVLASPLNPNQCLAVMLRHLVVILTHFERDGFSGLKHEWMDAHAYHQQPVRLLMPDGREIHGEVKGIGEDGILHIETPQGERRFSAGEISLRGVN